MVEETSPPSSRSAAGAALEARGQRSAALRAAHDLYRGSLADGLGAEWVLSVREATRRGFLSATARLVPPPRRRHASGGASVACRKLIYGGLS